MRLRKYSNYDCIFLVAYPLSIRNIVINKEIESQPNSTEIILYKYMSF